MVQSADTSQSSADAPGADASADASPATAAAGAVDSKPCTITLEDGSVISGMLVDEGGERLVVLREPKSAEEARTEMESSPPRELLRAEREAWDLSLKECIRLTFENRRGFHVTAPLGDEDRLTISPAPGYWSSSERFREAAADQLRDVADCYADLHFAYGDLESRRVAEADTLQTWRRVKARFVVGAEGGEEAAETQTRSQYFNCRLQVEVAQKNLFTVENRLRYLIGLAAKDGRLIRPSTPLEADERRYDWETVHAEALANRTELRDQRKVVEDHQRSEAVAEARLAGAQNGKLGGRLTETVARHCRLLTARETAVLKDMELSVAHQLGQAVRDVDLAYGMMRTNFDQRAAAEDDVKAVRAVNDAGRASTDLLLQAFQRRAEAESAHHRALADYARAKMRVEYRKGTLLEAHGIRVAE